MEDKEFLKAAEFAAMADLEDTWDTDYTTLKGLFIAGALWAKKELEKQVPKDPYEEVIL